MNNIILDILRITSDYLSRLQTILIDSEREYVDTKYSEEWKNLRKEVIRQIRDAKNKCIPVKYIVINEHAWAHWIASDISVVYSEEDHDYMFMGLKFIKTKKTIIMVI